MKETLQRIRENAISAINAPEADLEQIRIQYLGKKGELTSVLRGMGALSSEERPIVGQIANEVRAEIESALTQRAALLKQKQLEAKLISEKIDVTMPSTASKIGHIHRHGIFYCRRTRGRI